MTVAYELGKAAAMDKRAGLWSWLGKGAWEGGKGLLRGGARGARGAAGFAAKHPVLSYIGLTNVAPAAVGYGYNKAFGPSEAEQQAIDKANYKNLRENLGLPEPGASPPPKAPPPKATGDFAELMKNRPFNSSGTHWNPGLGALGAGAGALFGGATGINPIVTALLLGGAGAFLGPKLDLSGWGGPTAAPAAPAAAGGKS